MHIHIYLLLHTAVIGKYSKRTSKEERLLSFSHTLLSSNPFLFPPTHCHSLPPYQLLLCMLLEIPLFTQLELQDSKNKLED